MARIPLVAGNWKMNGSRAATAQLLDAVIAERPATAGREVLVCPPSVLIPAAQDRLGDSGIALGAQDLSEHASGAYTGEVSGAMLRDAGCTYVIVGHSERRALFGDGDARVAEKFVRAQGEELIPILCVGETLAEREDGATAKVIRRQLGAVLERAGVAAFEGAVIAYEPVWAIGTGKTAEPAQAQEVHAMIRADLAAQDTRVAAGLRILYGGSVKPGNAAELFAQADIDGGLIGGASLQAGDFISICQAAA
jgi:triosephosphate isomerase